MQPHVAFGIRLWVKWHFATERKSKSKSDKVMTVEKYILEFVRIHFVSHAIHFTDLMRHNLISTIAQSVLYVIRFVFTVQSIRIRSAIN